jgi:hypothetical protein
VVCIAANREFLENAVRAGVANPGKACAGKINYKDQCLESFISKDDEVAVTSVPELLPPALYQHEIPGQYH